MLRKTVSFRTVTVVTIRPDGSRETKKPDKTVDDKVNAWVEETGNIIVSAVPGMTTVVTQDGPNVVRSTVNMVQVVYMSEEDFFAAEAQARSAALRVGVRMHPEDDMSEDPIPVADDGDIDMAPDAEEFM